LAGGVALKGSQDWDERNGVFGMNFEQPRYDVQSSSPFSSQVTFRFKKSVFFYGDLIVSLGSSIEYYGGNKEIHTALFQDKMPENASPKPAEQDVFRCNDGGALDQTNWGNKALVTLVDVNGNRYFKIYVFIVIPTINKQSFHICLNINNSVYCYATNLTMDPRIVQSFKLRKTLQVYGGITWKTRNLIKI
jgi:hypothetical protein